MDYSQIIQHIYTLDTDQLDSDAIISAKKDFCNQNKVDKLPSNADIMKTYRSMLQNGQIERRRDIEKAMSKRGIRSQSGIVPVQVLTKPFWCPGECIFCPNDATMPKSYINTEPGAQRALLNNFDPYKQAYNRLLSLTLTGHDTDKIEMIVLGGTRDVYPKSYKIGFVKGLYDACNTFGQFFKKYNSGKIGSEDLAKVDIAELGIEYPTDISESIYTNQTAENRIIGLTIETRPEYVTHTNCQFRRDMGVTRIEMGIQSYYDEVLLANKRGHTIAQCRDAMHLLRLYGFKISVHIMPGLYMSSIDMDISTFDHIFTDIYFRPDEIKFYPTAIIPNTELFELYKKGLYKTLTTEENTHIIQTVLSKYIPPYTRIKRLVRDIPADETVGTEYITNLRQLVETQTLHKLESDSQARRALYSQIRPHIHTTRDIPEWYAQVDQHISHIYKNMQDNLTDIYTVALGIDIDIDSIRYMSAIDTRSREIQHKKDHTQKAQVGLIARIYRSSNGIEIFLSYEDQLGYLYGFARLMLPIDHSLYQDQDLRGYRGVGVDIAMIRELHVYGKLVSISARTADTQHQGIGSLLMSSAQQIASSHGYKKLSVISGVGVRGFYEKIGYRLDGTYMVIDL